MKIKGRIVQSKSFAIKINRYKQEKKFPNLFAGTLFGKIRYRRPFFNCPRISFGCSGSGVLRTSSSSSLLIAWSMSDVSREVSDHVGLATCGSSGPAARNIWLDLTWKLSRKWFSKRLPTSYGTFKRTKRWHGQEIRLYSATQCKLAVSFFFTKRLIFLIKW